MVAFEEPINHLSRFTKKKREIKSEMKEDIEPQLLPQIFKTS